MDFIFNKVETFCKVHNIEISDMYTQYIVCRGCMRNRVDHKAVEHCY